VDEFFPAIKKITFEGKQSRNDLSFRFYNPIEKVSGKTMREHLRFSVAYWHTFSGTGSDLFGAATITRPWNVGSSPMEIARKRLHAAFEFFTKLGVGYYCFHDRDIAPEGKNLSETNANLEVLCKEALMLQKETGVKLLWGTANLFSHPRYMNGAATNPDPHVFAYAAAQVKKMIEITLMLGGENYVFWGGREGYDTLLNTDLKREREHLATFMHMAVDYAKKIGFKGQLLIEPKPKEPTKHQYDFDVASVIGFLKEFDLDKKIKLNIEANHATLAGHSFAHELALAASYNMLGSIDANRGDLLLGWDTDQFPTNLYDCVEAMLVVLNNGGLGTGGLNFDAKLRRASIEPEDLFFAHIGGMDAFAIGLKVAHRIIQDGWLKDLLAKRYRGYDEGIGKKIEQGRMSFKELEMDIADKGEPVLHSGRQEYIENVINRYLFSVE
jgi:xylose isomerase